jgi:uncharacterized protein
MTEREIAEQNTVLRATVGSTLHGLALEGTDDRDEMGVCIEPPQYVVGLQRFEQWVHRSKPEGVRSQAGDLDLTVYSLRKWCRLALKGNPTVLLLLFAPPEYCSVRSEIGAKLQGLAPLFVSRRAGIAHLGYLRAQKQRLLGVRGQKRTQRPELEHEHGYDTKYAMHMLRLGFQGIELMQHGRLVLPMKEWPREFLRSVREGDVDLTQVVKTVRSLERKLQELVEMARLPEQGDAQSVDQFLLLSYAEHWANCAPTAIATERV